MGNLYDEEEWEAIIEAVLFTMGKSVELKQLAVAIGQSEEIAKRVVLHLQKRYEEEKRGMRILELENAYQMCTCADYYENLIRVVNILRCRYHRVIGIVIIYQLELISPAVCLGSVMFKNRLE